MLPSNLKQTASMILEQLRREKGYSIATIAAHLGYASPNSIERIVRGQAGDTACKKFVEQCAAIYPDLVPLSGDQALVLPAQHSYWTQLLQGNLNTPEVPVKLYDGDGCILGSISQYYASLNASSISVLLLNGLHFPLQEELTALLSLPNVNVNHCITRHYPADHYSKALISLIPLFFQERYLISFYDAKHDTCGLLGADIMLVRYCFQNMERTDMISFVASDRAAFIPLPQRLSFEQLGLASVLQNMQPLCHRKDLDFQEDYLGYISWCAMLEKEGPIRQLKEDICFSQIPTPILALAFREGIAASQGDNNPLMNTIPSIAAICNERRQTWYLHCKEHIHMMCLTSLWRFVRTGMLSDHFWGMRAFSVQERIAILEEILQMHNGNHFRLLFLPDAYWKGPGEITCYGKSSISILQHNTNYHLSVQHKEILLTDPKIIQSYISYFDEALIPLCESTQQVSSVLEEMLHELKTKMKPI